MKTLITNGETYYNLGLSDIKNNNLAMAKADLQIASNYFREAIRNSNDVSLKLKKQMVDNVLADVRKKVLDQTKEKYVKDEKEEEIKPIRSDRYKAEENNITLEDVKGLSDVKLAVKRNIINPFIYSDLYKEFNRKVGGGILLYGVPGTGKSLIAKAIANEIEAEIFIVKCSDINSRWFGDSENRVKELFDEARKYDTSIIFFDEFDALGSTRHQSEANSGTSNRIVSELLSQMQGFNENKNNLIFIAATNRPWDIDSAFLRSGRFGVRIMVDLPNAEARKEIIEAELENVPSEVLDFDSIASLTDGYSGADMTEFANRLKDLAIERSIENNLVSPIKADDVQIVLDTFKSSVRAKDIEEIKKYNDNIS